MDVHIDIVGARQVGVRFETFPDALYADLKAEIDALGAELLARVAATTPSRTGALRASERLRLFADKDRITADVDVAQDFAKAGALEYGAHRPTTVRAHRMRLDHAWGEQLARPLTVLVAAYTRTPDIAEHAFERGPLEAMQPEILARLQAVVDASAATANGD